MEFSHLGCISCCGHFPVNLNHHKDKMFLVLPLHVSNLVLIHVHIDTEIDWKAYMEEVEGFLSGERNYFNIRGGTGPLGEIFF